MPTTPPVHPPGLVTVSVGVLLATCLGAGCAPTAGPAPDAAESLTWRFTDTSLACDRDGNVYIAGAEQFPETAQILVAASQSYGDRWPQHFEYVNRQQAGDRGRPQVVATRSRTVYVLWEDTRDGPLHAYLNRSLDGGVTWLPQDRRVDAEPGSGRGISSPRLVADDRRACVVWLDDREGFDAFYANRSDDAGDTWMPQDIRITGIDIGRKSAPRLEGDGRGGVYLAWVELTNGRQEVRFTSSRDDGRTWDLQPRILSSSVRAERILPVDMSILDSGVVVVGWTQYQFDGRASTWVARSPDRGQSWGADPVELPSELPGLFNPSAPLLVSEGFDDVHVAWQAMTGNQVPLIIVKSSRDGARTFQERRISRPRMLDSAVIDYRTTRRYLQPFSTAGDGNGNVYFAWVDLEPARARLGFRRLSQQDIAPGFTAPPELDVPGIRPATTEPPALCADITGHVYLLWNEARSLTFATSPFLGDTGWRFERF